MTSTSAIVVVAVCAVVSIGYVDAGCCSDPLPSSCREVWPICESGYFLISPCFGLIYAAYCPNWRLCGSTGWTRVGIADFGNPETPCPDGLIEHVNGTVRACKRRGLPPAPNNVIIPTMGISYSQVCGKILGYQYSTVDGFYDEWTGPDDIEDSYFDGISVTYGPAGSRQHIFSLAGGNGGGTCPCYVGAGNGQPTPPFVGEDYYCESGNLNSASVWDKYFFDDVLWDGQQCGGGEAPCCTSPYLPYFYKDLSNYTTEDIELRILPNQDTVHDEDILLLSYEIYIK